MTRLPFRWAVAGLAAAALAPAARADLVLTFDRTDPGQDVAMHVGPAGYDPQRAGVMPFTIVSGDPAGLSSPIRAFCVEFTEQVSPGKTATYLVVPVTDLSDLRSPPSGTADPVNKAAYLTELWGRYADRTTTAEGAAAFQLAVWEIVYDRLGALDLLSGYLRVDPASAKGAVTADSPTVALAAGWLASLSGDTRYFTDDPRYAGGELVGLASDGSQDQITVRTPPAVPAPPGLVLGLIGLGAAVAGRARRSRAG